MTRKIKLACDQSQTHHALAQLAITQAGLAKGFKDTDGFEHAVVLDDEGVRGEGGDYRIQYLPGKQVVCKTVSSSDCEMLWQFSWPGLKLIAYRIKACRCSDIEEIESVHSDYR